MGGGTQPVMWLKKNKARLYQQYREECIANEKKNQLEEPNSMKVLKLETSAKW